jgi:carboxylesterase type B
MRIAQPDMDAFKPPYSFAPAANGPVAADSTALDITDVQIEGHAQDITLRLYRQARKTALPVLLYFHGGGFTKGSIEQADFAARYFAEHLPALVVSVGYSLAPQFPFPAAPEDAHRAALWVQTRARAFGGNSRKVGVAGHDAGGQLANCLAFIVATCRLRRRRCSGRCSTRASRVWATNSVWAPTSRQKSARRVIARICRKRRSACTRMRRRSNRRGSRGCRPR